MAKTKKKKITKKKAIMSSKDFVEAKVQDFKKNVANEMKVFHQQTGFHIVDIQIFKTTNLDTLRTIKRSDIGHIDIG